jgi:hypothetical protein
MAAAPSVMGLYKPGCFAVFLANAWRENVEITVSRAGQVFDVRQIARVVGEGADVAKWASLGESGLAPGQVAVLFLSHDPEANSGTGTDTRCPITPAVATAGGAAVYVAAPEDMPFMPAQQTGKGSAFEIATTGPVTAYDILPFGGASSVDPSSSLLWPMSAWGKNYVAIVPPMKSSDESNTQWGQVVASVDGTKVDLVATSTLPGGGGIPGAPAGVLTSYVLNRGEFIQWQDAGEMSGTAILADQPIAFYGGASAFTYDSSLPECGNGASDNAHQQLPPVSALGSEYLAAPYTSRVSVPELVPYRLVGFVEDTALTYDPPQLGAPTSLARGEVVELEADMAFTVRSQDHEHPFYVAQIMTGCGGGEPSGDEEFVNVLPAAQYLSRYVFFSDPTYSTTQVVLTRRRGSAGFADVEVECLGIVSGWTDVGADGEYQVTNVDLVRGGAGVGSCANGRQVAQSAGQFGLTVWGLDQWASYGYPAGGRAAPIHTVVVPPVVK